MLDQPNLDVLPVRSIDPITRLSGIQPFYYTFSVDLGQTWEGTPSTLLQECNSITERNQPFSCPVLCEHVHKIDPTNKEKMDACRLRLRNNFECCDVEMFTAGKTARVLVDDIFSKGEVPEDIMAGILGEGELLREAESRLFGGAGSAPSDEYPVPRGANMRAAL